MNVSYDSVVTAGLDVHEVYLISPVGTSVLMFGPRAVHDVAADGTVTSTPYLDPPTDVLLTDVVAGPAGYGAIMGFDERVPPETKFCILDAAGAFDEARCVLLGTSFLDYPKVAFDGVDYRAYLIRNDMMHRWTLESAPSFASEADLWPTFNVDSSILAVRASSTEDFVVTRGFGDSDLLCSTVREHRWGAGHETRSLLPDQMAEITLSVPPISPSGEASLAVVYDAACVDGNDCPGFNDLPGVSFLTRYDSAWTATTQRIPLPGRGPAAIFADGTSTVLIYYVDPETIELSRFDASGETEISRQRLSLACSSPGSEVSAVYEAIALGPGDYLLSYRLVGPSGLEGRVARFRLE